MCREPYSLHLVDVGNLRSAGVSTCSREPQWAQEGQWARAPCVLTELATALRPCCHHPAVMRRIQFVPRAPPGAAAAAGFEVI